MEQELHPPPAVPRLKTRTSRPQGGQSQHRAEARCAPASLLCFFGALRGVLRRKKARQGIRSTPTGLKRLKTQNTASYDCNAKWERPYLALPNLYTSANSFRKKNSSTLPTLANDPNCDTNEPLSALGGSVCIKGVHSEPRGVHSVHLKSKEQLNCRAN